jgi:NADH-quinone oxidoreductase subunit B
MNDARPAPADDFVTTLPAGITDTDRTELRRQGILLTSLEEFYNWGRSHSVCLIVSGTVTKKMAPQVVRLWNQMPEPKYCIAMGACAISGGPFKQGYNVLKGIDRFIPVDIYIPGCPPRPEALLNGLIALQEKIRAQKLTGPDAPRHLRPDDRCEYPVPEFGDRDLVPPQNPAVWQPPTIVRKE